MVMSDTFMTMSAVGKEKTVPAGEFKAKCLALFDEVEAGRRTFVVTKRGRPVARIVPLEPTETSLHGTLIHEEGLLEPIDVAWEANS